MSSSYKRIQSNDVKFGDSFVLSAETDEDGVRSLSAQKKQLQDEIANLQAELNRVQENLKKGIYQKDNIINDANEEARFIKSNAEQEAKKILVQAENQQNEVFENAKQEGQKQGFEAGYNEGQEGFLSDYKKQLDALNALANASFDVKNEIIFSAESEILELALLIAKKVVQVDFEKDAECFKNMIQTALSLLKEKENIKIIVNPKLFDYAKEFSEEFSQRIETFEQIKVIQDKAVTPDGAVVESLESRIDARISSEMEKLARTLLVDKREAVAVTEEIDKKITVKAQSRKK